MTEPGYGHSSSAPAKSYIGQALISLALYYLGFWIVGLVVNVLFLREALQYRRSTARPVSGVGCLWAVLVVHVVVPLSAVLLALVVVAIALVLGLLSVSDLPV